jgi:SAM-dependent methyltransferase
MPQAEHYDTIISEYDRHYFDETAMAYRRRYLYPRLFDGLDLNGLDVIELACGTGYNTLEVLKLFPEARIAGMDVSPNVCEAYRQRTGRDALLSDLTKGNSLPRACFDVAFVVGGLHHCNNDIRVALTSVFDTLRPGGRLLMIEPNARFFLNVMRKAWYRRDKWFDEAEEDALDHAALLGQAEGLFNVESVSFAGGPAYFGILNSLVLRVPINFKPMLAIPLFGLESLYNLLPGQAPFPMFTARWRRTSLELSP